MAEEIQIRGGDAMAKKRDPLAIVGLSIITLGIYFLVWYFKTNKELAALGRSRGTEALGTSPGVSLLAVTLGVLVIVPPFVSLFHTWKRLQAAEKLTGVDGTDAGLGFLLSVFLAPIGHYMFQADLNKVLTAQAGEPALSAPPALA